MKVVQPDGEVTKSGGQVVKNVSGYDMSRLHIGGLGTLGTILEASSAHAPTDVRKDGVGYIQFPPNGNGHRVRVFNSQVMPLALTGSMTPPRSGVASKWAARVPGSLFAWADDRERSTARSTR